MFGGMISPGLKLWYAISAIIMVCALFAGAELAFVLYAFAIGAVLALVVWVMWPGRRQGGRPGSTDRFPRE